MCGHFDNRVSSNPKELKGEKIVNLFEDTGNFHDEEKLQQSYERVSENDKRHGSMCGN